LPNDHTMEIITTSSALKHYLSSRKGDIGFVPTMGALHEGHATLVRRAAEENGTVVSSIFVNPTQFNNPEDFKTYPVTMEADCQLLEAAGCHVVFCPDVSEVYPSGTAALPTRYWPGPIAQVYEGEHRPGHFEGVVNVVERLFSMVEPHDAYFGLKDLQQYFIIKKMAEKLFHGLTIIGVPTVRETDGLAMSSRNRRLTPDERQVAPQLYQALQQTKKMLLDDTPISIAEAEALNTLAGYRLFQPEYLSVIDMESFSPATANTPIGSMAVVAAAHLGKARLIDNLIISDRWPGA